MLSKGPKPSTTMDDFGMMILLTFVSAVKKSGFLSFYILYNIYIIYIYIFFLVHVNTLYMFMLAENVICPTNGLLFASNYAKHVLRWTTQIVSLSKDRWVSVCMMCLRGGTCAR